MRYAAGRKEKTRARILGAAGKVFRQHGYHAAGVDKVMEEAGLTAGGFYAHFDSKQGLLAEALAGAGAEVMARHEEALEGLSGGAWIEAYVGRYLSMAHRDRVAEGCPLAALVSETSRAGEPVKESFEALVREIQGKLASHAEGDGPAPAQERALAVLALCVGGLGLARSVRDDGLAGRILESCRAMAIEALHVAEKPTGPARPPRKRKGS